MAYKHRLPGGPNSDVNVFELDKDHSEWCNGTCGNDGFSSNPMEYCQVQQEMIIAAQPPCYCSINRNCPRHS